MLEKPQSEELQTLSISRHFPQNARVKCNEETRLSVKKGIRTGRWQRTNPKLEAEDELGFQSRPLAACDGDRPRRPSSLGVPLSSIKMWDVCSRAFLSQNL